jgi:iron(III) transport system ATP-binding protein
MAMMQTVNTSSYRSKGPRQSETQAVVELHNVTYRYEGAGAPAVEDVSLDVYPGEVLALLGPSGCGKSTTLRLIAGLEQPDEGEIRLKGTRVAGAGRALPPEERHLGMVFQDYALFPHMTALENITFALHALPARERRSWGAAALALVGLADLADRYPHQLSGGQQQRVALARALAPGPPVVLLDEPFSNLDAALRAQMREELREILDRAGATTVFVTHDQGEALGLGDRIALLRGGRLEQIGTPDELFQHPRSRFVASFMGQADFLPAEVTEHGLRTEIGDIPQQVALPQGAQVEVLVRYDDLSLTADRDGAAWIARRVYEGQSYAYVVALPSGRQVRCKTSHVHSYPVGTQVRVELLNDHLLTCFVGAETIESRLLAAFLG